MLRRRTSRAHGAPLAATLIAGGRSNLTYSITDGTTTWVLRRPPLGHVLPTAHDMAREYRVMSALARTAVPVPRTLALCEDDAVNDAPFYVMELVDGVIYRDGAALASPRRIRRPAAVSEALVDVLVAIHAVDYEAVGLGDFGRPDGFLERQVRRWGEQWERSKTRELPAVDELARRLRNALPDSGPPTIVHGDYRLDNTMVGADDPGRSSRSSTGRCPRSATRSPTSGCSCSTGAAPTRRSSRPAPRSTTQPGFLTRDEIVERYARVSGRPVDQLDWYQVFAAYKLAIIVEGINARYQMGKTLGDGFEAMGAMVSGLINGALDQANRSEIAALRA